MYQRATRRLLAAALLVAAFSSAHAETPAIMVVTSDPQYPWTDETDRGGETDNALAEALVREQYESIVRFREAHPSQQIPVVVNGDLTSHGFYWEHQKMDELLRILGDNVYLGLGNHDYQNNLASNIPCKIYTCAMESLDLLSAHARGHHLRNRLLGMDQRTYAVGGAIGKEGSWAYGFIADGWNRVVNIQLNNSPTYSADIYSARYEYHVTPSVPWLARHLLEWDQPATSDFVLLHTHKPSDWTNRPSSELIELVGKHRVKAVFAGHYHRHMGVSFYPSYWGFIPVFISGSASQRTYLIVEHWPESRRLKVYGVRNNDWQNKELLKDIDV
jgi:predicted phosphohydrolase